jgi:tRNA(Ile2) C34 agmatinyltransferase TiaS
MATGNKKRAYCPYCKKPVAKNGPGPYRCKECGKVEKPIWKRN